LTKSEADLRVAKERAREEQATAKAEQQKQGAGLAAASERQQRLTAQVEQERQEVGFREKQAFVAEQDVASRLGALAQREKAAASQLLKVEALAKQLAGREEEVDNRNAALTTSEAKVQALEVGLVEATRVARVLKEDEEALRIKEAEMASRSLGQEEVARKLAEAQALNAEREQGATQVRERQHLLLATRDLVYFHKKRRYSCKNFNNPHLLSLSLLSVFPLMTATWPPSSWLAVFGRSGTGTGGGP